MIKYAYIIYFGIVYSFVAGEHGIALTNSTLEKTSTKEDIAHFGWQLSLTSNFRHFCGAAILSSDWAITTAYCAQRVFVNAARCHAGSNESGGLDWYHVQNLVVHPKFDGKNDYDVALIEVSDRFPRNRRIRPIKLVEADTDIPVNSVVTATGWGFTKYGNKPYDELKATTLPVIDNETCKLRNNEFMDVNDKMFCAGHLDDVDNKNSNCASDYGGPIVDSNGRLVGLASSLVACYVPEHPNVYTRLSNPEIRKFIKDFTKL